MTVRGFFLDRDGVINVPPPPETRYVTRPEDFHLQPGIAEAIRHLNQLNLRVGVVTNQKGIALGRYTRKDLDRIHDRMRELLAAHAARVDDIRFCPHTEADDCPCRKPRPGMILAGAEAMGVDPSRCWMVGDQPRDLRAGRAAGCRTLYIGSEGIPPELADARLERPADFPDWLSENFPFQIETEVP